MLMQSYYIPLSVWTVASVSLAFRCNITTKPTNLSPLNVVWKEVYRLRRQAEIMECMTSILNKISQTEEKVGRIGITKVKLSPDCTHALISVHIAAENEGDVEQGLAWLGRHSKALRYQLGTKLNYRKRVPAIQFAYDKKDIFDVFDINEIQKEIKRLEGLSENQEKQERSDKDNEELEGNPEERNDINIDIDDDINITFEDFKKYSKDILGKYGIEEHEYTDDDD